MNARVRKERQVAAVRETDEMLGHSVRASAYSMILEAGIWRASAIRTMLA
jgi:hypothetical protein